MKGEPSRPCPRCGAASPIAQEAEPDVGILTDTFCCQEHGPWWRRPGRLEEFEFLEDGAAAVATTSGQPLEAFTLDDLLRARRALEELELPADRGAYVVHLNPKDGRRLSVECDAWTLLVHLDLALAVGPSGGGARRARDRRRLVRARAMLRAFRGARGRTLEAGEAANRAARDALPPGDRPRLLSDAAGLTAVPIVEDPVVAEGTIVEIRTPVPPTLRSR